MRVLITGGAGFIGSHIADACLADGHQVLVLDNLSTGRQDNLPCAAEFAEGDICNPDTVAGVFADFRPDVVSHQAAQTSVAVGAREPIFDAEVNVIGSLRILQAAVRYDCRVVFASTGGAIYGEVADGECADTAWTPNPLSPYACSKYAVENYLKAFGHEHGLRSSVLRYANVYGPRQDPHGEAGVVAIFIQRLLEGAAIQVNALEREGDDGCVRDYVYVQDVVRANLSAILGNLPSAVVNVGTGKATTTLELAQILESLMGVPAEIRFGPRRQGDLKRSVLRVSQSLGQPTALRTGLQETVAWFRSHGKT